MYRINKYVDLIDRFVWTFLQSFLGIALVDQLASGLDAQWRHKLAAAAVAAAIAAGKTIGGQQLGDSPVGDVVPGFSAIERVR